MELLDLGSARWRDLGQSIHGPYDLRALLAQVDKMADWSAERFGEQTPFSDLAMAIGDSGFVYEAAYAVVPHLMEMARGRAAKERLFAVELLLDAALPDQESDLPVPEDLRRGYREALLACGSMARAAAAELELNMYTARMAVAAVLLSDGRPAAADLARRTTEPWIDIECPRCRSLLWLYVELETLEMQRAEQMPEHVPGPRRPGPAALDAPSREIQEVLAAADTLNARGFVEALSQLDVPRPCLACKHPFRPITAVLPPLRQTPLVQR
jgi:hypothetical protein